MPDEDIESAVRLDERAKTLRAAARRLLSAAAELAPATSEALTRREVEILRLAAAGKTGKQTAEALYVSEETVKSHLQHAYRKLGAHGRTHAVALAYECGAL